MPWELLVAQFGPALLAEGLVQQADLDAFAGLCHDGTTVFFAPVMVSSWGRSPKVSEDRGCSTSAGYDGQWR